MENLHCMPKHIAHVLEKRDHPSIHKFIVFFGFPLAKQQSEKHNNVATQNHTGNQSPVKIQINNKQQSTMRPPQL